MRSIRSNHAKAENRRNFIPIRRLKSDRHLLFPRDEICWNWIPDIKETDRAAFLNCLFADFLAFNKYVKGSLPPFITVITHEQLHRMRRFDWQIERKPISPTTCGAAHNAIRGRVLALHVEVAFRLHFAGLGESNRGAFKFVLALAFGGNFSGFLFPAFRRKQVPVNGVCASMKPIERNEINIGFPAHTVGTKLPRFVSNGFEPFGDRFSRRNEHRNSSGIAVSATKTLWPKIASENKRAPKNGDAIRIVRQGFKVKRFRQSNGNGIS